MLDELFSSMNLNVLALGALPWILSYITVYLGPLITLIVSNFLTVFTIDTLDDYDNCKKVYAYIMDNSQLIGSYKYEMGKKKPCGICISFSKLFIANIATKERSFGPNGNNIWYIGIAPDINLKTTALIAPEITELSKDDLDKYSLATPKLVKIIDKGGRISEINMYFRPTHSQATVLDSIIKGFDSVRCRINNNVYKVLISGESGSGKSTLAKLLAGQMDSYLIYGYDMKTNNINKFYDRKDHGKPLIIQVDEFDVYISWMHQNTIHCIDKVIKLSKDDDYDDNNMKELINNKQKYNMLMSDIINLKRDVIYIFTTNKSIEWFNDLDTSYIAPSRIDATFIMDGNAKNDANLQLDY